MKIYNSLTKQKQDFLPLKKPYVNMYTCGVTVYDDCHIGHARSLFVFDMMRRYMLYKGYKVNFVRNITDIDDKIINRSNELKIPWNELVEKYIKSYDEDLKTLGIEKGIVDKDAQEPRASSNITEMIEYIKVLLDKGYAYIENGDVYFNVRKFKDYGKLSGQDIEKMMENVRIEKDENKKDPLDFALWKSSKPQEPFWESPWGRGRPGWHIECSVMSQKFLKTQTLDIHAGGRDLVFPHHENEIAQSEAYTGKPFANYWIHHGLLTINGQKMSKSLGNFITIKDFLSKYKDPEILKILFLSSHYASPVDFSDEKIEEIKAKKDRFYNLFAKIERWPIVIKNKEKLLKDIMKLKEQFINDMDDDFNTPAALSRLFDMVSLVNAEASIDNSAEKCDILAKIKNIFIELGAIFGLFSNLNKKVFTKEEEKVLLGILIKYSPEDKGHWGPEDIINKLIDVRNKARADKDFKKSDKIRNDLLRLGNIALEDGPGGTLWRKI